MLDTLPLFPLSAHVLPGGKLQLRIFEARYIRMVKEACRDDAGFGVCMLKNRSGNTLHNMLPIGTRVKVVDFEQTPEGLLGITVQGVDRFRIQDVWAEQDGLKVGNVSYLPNWEPEPLPGESRHLLDGLCEIYRRHHHLAELHPEPLSDDASWICQRWLELIPLAPEDKHLLVEQNDCLSALKFLTDTVQLK
ncbi:LON peptidase substrate-binding domain-containing protein [Corallincola platygyrae]|uniref:LON peptidase substrate-binding domain-containing protein n=1 Tax=Corallincola platygyrae TaxID=1193278 RepID=A0ABW4XN57_9GAMM